MAARWQGGKVGDEFQILIVEYFEGAGMWWGVEGRRWLVVDHVEDRSGLVAAALIEVDINGGAAAA